MDVVQKSPNHAILIKGIKQNEQGHLVAVVNDPGRPDGAGVEYPLEQFEEAFNDSDFHYVATDAPAADWVEPSLDPSSLSELFPMSEAPSHDVWDGYRSPELFADFISGLDERRKNGFLKNL